MSIGMSETMSTIPSNLSLPATTIAGVPGNAHATLADTTIMIYAIGGVVLFLFFFVLIFAMRYYRRCPPNQILVIFGKVAGGKAAKCLHGGGTFVVPLIQDFTYLNLEPKVIDIPLQGALSQNNIRVNVPATFTVGISTDPVLMNNAAERLAALDTDQIREQAQDIILGQLRLVIATLTIEEINRDREKFMSLINENVGKEINKIGLELINVNVRDITDESGYIEAIGKRAAAEAVNRAKVEVAQQERDGATGEAIAVRERNVSVSQETASSAEGQKKAEQAKRIALAALEADAVKGEVTSQRDIEINRAQREAETAAAKKLAEQEQRVRIAESEATAVIGENTARQKTAESQAKLAEIQAEARRRSEVAAAEAQRAILTAERERELARLAKEQIVPQEIEKQRMALAAEAEAEKRRREAQGDADAILAKYEAEAAGVQKVMEAKAEGYRKLIEACGSDPAVGPTLLLIEQLPKLVEQQVKAISTLKIDKITVWDSGTNSAGGRNTTADFLAGMVNSLPRLHELANQAGIQLPAALGRLSDSSPASTPSAGASGEASKGDASKRG
jgi:flotillin